MNWRVRFDSGAALILGLLAFCGSCAGPSAGGGPVPNAALVAHVGTGGIAHLMTSAALAALTIRKWRLDNGLEIVTLPETDARSVTMVTAFRVGSRDDDSAAGETGLAHLCEHLMFSHARADFDQRLEEIGGVSNAQTAYDFTSYTDDIPPEALERTIRLEADRMLNLNLDPEPVARERDVVIAERLATVDDSVDGSLDEVMYGQAFPSHPYGWPIVGRLGDIKAVTREKVLAFYHLHYAPAHAIVALGGHFDEAAALEMLRATYGVLPAGIPADAALPAKHAPTGEARTTILRPVAADRLVIGFPAPALGDPDRVAYELLAELLTGGPSSRLVRLLVVKRELASSIAGDVAPTRDPGLWAVWVQMTKGHQAREAEDLISREIERVLVEPVSPLELDAVKQRLETAFWQRLESSHARTEAVALFDATTGDFRDLITRGPATGRVTADDLRRVARIYLGAGARSVVIARPKKNAGP